MLPNEIDELIRLRKVDKIPEDVWDESIAIDAVGNSCSNIFSIPKKYITNNVLDEYILKARCFTNMRPIISLIDENFYTEENLYKLVRISYKNLKEIPTKYVTPGLINKLLDDGTFCRRYLRFEVLVSVIVSVMPEYLDDDNILYKILKYSYEISLNQPYYTIQRFLELLPENIKSSECFIKVYVKLSMDYDIQINLQRDIISNDLMKYIITKSVVWNRHLTSVFEPSCITKDMVINYFNKYRSIYTTDYNYEKIEYLLLIKFIISSSENRYYWKFIDYDVLIHAFAESALLTTELLTVKFSVFSIYDYAKFINTLKNNLSKSEFTKILELILTYSNKRNLPFINKYFHDFMTDSQKFITYRQCGYKGLFINKEMLHDKSILKKLLNSDSTSCDLYMINETYDKPSTILNVGELYNMATDKEKFIEILSDLFDITNIDDDSILTSSSFKMITE